MPAYNFQKQFVEKIRSGEKRSTIRGRRKHGNAEPGKPLQLYMGQRTTSCEKIIPDPLCTQVHPIIINYEGGILQIVLDNRRLLRDEVHALAVSDGFDDVKSFAAFFIRTYQLPANLYLIEWK